MMAMIALNEINSIKISVNLLHHGMIAVTKSGDLKLFNMNNLSLHGHTLDIVQSNFNSFIHYSKLKVNPANDT